jgi:hypothetical protein
MAGAGIITILVLLATIPFNLFKAWMDGFKQLPPREAETTRAAHGVGLAVLMPLVMTWADKYGWLGILPRDWWHYLIYRWFVVYAIMAFGVYWFVVGVARSRGYRDGRQITRALLKLAFGVVIIYVQINHLYMDLPLRDETFLLVTLAGYWCIITGIVKLGIYMVGPPRRRMNPEPAAMPHGDADYGTGGGLRGR